MKDILLGHISSILLIVPALGAGSFFLFAQHRKAWIRNWGLLVSLLVFVGWLGLFREFRGAIGFEFSEFAAWIPELGIHYWVGLDGISILFVGLVFLVTPFLPFLSRKEGDSRVTGALCLLMASVWALYFMALDMLLCLIAYEIATLLTFIFIRRESRQSEGAAWFLAINLVGSLALWLGLFVVARAAGDVTDLASLIERVATPDVQKKYGVILLLGLLLKSGAMPLQMWIGRVLHGATPATYLLMLALVIKASLYFVFRFAYPLFPVAVETYAPLFSIIGLISVIGGAALCLAPSKLPARLVWLSVAHVGLLWMGVSLLTVDAAQSVFMILTGHSLIVIIFSLVMYVQQVPTESSDPLKEVQPLGKAFLSIAMASALGLPGTGLFVGIILLLSAAVAWHLSAAIITIIGFIIVACAVAICCQDLRTQTLYWRRSLRYWAAALIIVMMMVVTGLQPHLLLDKTRRAATLWLSKVKPEILVEGGYDFAARNN